MRSNSYGLFINTKQPFDQALEAAKDALKAEGFGVLTDIDVMATLKQKLGVDFRHYEILGACNPPLANQALQMELGVGLLLPCNVIVYEDEEGGSVVGALDPLSMMSVTGNPELSSVAKEARTRLERALASLEA